MVPLDAGWNDLGAWDAVWQVAQRTRRATPAWATPCQDSRNTLVHATSRLVAVVGLDDVMVVETPDAVLVADRERSQDVKKIVAALAREGRGEHTLHRKVHRPWGWYDSIDEGERFQVKRIMVKPGAPEPADAPPPRRALDRGQGTAEVTNGDKTLILLTENQSTYIPLGEVHRLANPGKVPLEIIEVQSGSYLGEDDIVRFEDTYGEVPAEPDIHDHSRDRRRRLHRQQLRARLAGAIDEPVVNLDALTYAGNLRNLASLQGDARHRFVQGDITDRALLDRLLAEHRPRAIVHFAAESHVDRSIHGPGAFIKTNVEGTFTLLEAARAYWSTLEGDARQTPSASSMSAPTRSTAAWRPTRRPSPRPTPTSPTAPTRPARPPATTWCAPGSTPTACRC
jgi:mannose-6-phosphate isomerase-like protein (cupin superfamily)